MDEVPQPRRFPHAVFGVGEEPDPRFTLANERTFLAWIRTALAFLAGAVALASVSTRLDDTVERAMALVLAAVGVVCTVVAVGRWTANEKALRTDRPLSGFAAGVGIAVTTVLIGVGVGAVLLWR